MKFVELANLNTANRISRQQAQRRAPNYRGVTFSALEMFQNFEKSAKIKVNWADRLMDSAFVVDGKRRFTGIFLS